MAPKKTTSNVPAFFSKMMAELDCAVMACNVEANCNTKVSLGDPSLDWAVGGGVARNRMNVFAGQSGSGKTYLCAQSAGKIQQESSSDSWVIIFDAEYYYKEEPERVARLATLGIDLKRSLIISSNQPNVVFSKLDGIETAMKEKEINVCAIIIDSLGGLEDKQAADKFAEGEIEEVGNKFGGMGKFIGSLVRKLLRMSAENQCTILMVQHAIIDMASAGKGQPKYIVTGGTKLRLLSDLFILSETVERKDALITADNESVEFSDKGVVASGKTVRFKCLKSRFCMEGRVAEVKIRFDICKIVRLEDSLCSLAKALGVLTHPVNEVTGKSNALWWKFTFAPEKYQGEKQVIEALKNKELYTKVHEECMRINDVPVYNNNDTIDMELQ